MTTLSWQAQAHPHNRLVRFTQKKGGPKMGCDDGDERSVSLRLLTQDSRRNTLLMALVAGWVNAVAMAQLGIACAHVTGHFTVLGRMSEESSSRAKPSPLLLIAAYCLGGITLAALKEIRSHWLPRGGFIMQALLFMGAMKMDNGWSGVYLAVAMGLQNGYTSSVRKVRTTHLTGLMTDLCHDVVLIARDLKRKSRLRGDIRTFGIHLCVLACFVAGAAAGWQSAALYGLSALIAPTLTCLLLCVIE